MDCRRLISNAIVYWNTRYIAHALESLERQGHTLTDADVRHIHPVHYEHINPFGHYRFDTRRRWWMAVRSWCSTSFLRALSGLSSRAAARHREHVLSSGRGSLATLPSARCRHGRFR